MDPTFGNVPRPVSDRGNPHGRTVSWIFVGIVIAAFALGGLAIILTAWWLLVICVVVLVLAIPVGHMIHIMSDTVGWSGATPPHIQRGHIVHEATRIYEAEHHKKSDGEIRAALGPTRDPHQGP
jgi:hypothetical protein